MWMTCDSSLLSQWLLCEPSGMLWALGYVRKKGVTYTSVGSGRAPCLKAAANSEPRQCLERNSSGFICWDQKTPKPFLFGDLIFVIKQRASRLAAGTDVSCISLALPVLLGLTSGS
ncbi:hypothetical protein CC2G_000360 [Coprinopsis cinerea AmutBmut pab1-1]|nr:hypothetical protein CC2G_000360 [Coprinopsis cinerea AmutBmut pab1-1]